MNPYDILEISHDVSLEEIKIAYRKLALKYHPDKNRDDGAHEKFLSIKKAYELLKDDDLKKYYNIIDFNDMDEFKMLIRSLVGNDNMSSIWDKINVFRHNDQYLIILLDIYFYNKNNIVHNSSVESKFILLII